MPQLADVGCIGRKEQAIFTAGYPGFLGGIWEGYLRRTCEKGDISGTSSSASLIGSVDVCGDTHWTTGATWLPPLLPAGMMLYEALAKSPSCATIFPAVPFSVDVMKEASSCQHCKTDTPFSAAVVVKLICVIAETAMCGTSSKHKIAREKRLAIIAYLMINLHAVWVHGRVR